MVAVYSPALSFFLMQVEDTTTILPQSYTVLPHSCTPLPWPEFLVVIEFIIKSPLDVEGFVLDYNNITPDQIWLISLQWPFLPCSSWDYRETRRNYFIQDDDWERLSIFKCGQDVTTLGFSPPYTNIKSTDRPPSTDFNGWSDDCIEVTREDCPVFPHWFSPHLIFTYLTIFHHVTSG